MAASPELGGEPVYESITISLRPENTSAGSKEFNREIRLTTDKPTAKVGRASKTVSKGLIPAVDNAFFDSPVVSRAHAEFAGNFIDGSVTVEDLGSLHGTSLNDTRLETNTPTLLEQDDSISFGIHVSRGLDVFYPTSCQIELSRTPKKPVERARSYCAPDSDVDLSDGSVSDDCSSVHSHGNNKDKPIPLFENDDGSSSDDGMSVEEIEICPEQEVLPPLGTYSIGLPAEFDDMDGLEEAENAEDDEDEVEEDYGEVDDDGDEEENEDEGSSEEDEEDEDIEEEEDYDEDEPFGEEEDEEEDTNDGGEGDYLMNELRTFTTKVDAIYSPASPILGRESTPTGDDTLPVHGLWTPPAISVEDVAMLSRIVESEFRDEQNGHVEEIEQLVVASDKNTVNDTMPRLTSAKLDISSILNPSPPTSSPAKSADDSSSSPVAVTETQTGSTLFQEAAKDLEKAGRTLVGIRDIINTSRDKTPVWKMPPLASGSHSGTPAVITTELSSSSTDEQIATDGAKDKEAANAMEEASSTKTNILEPSDSSNKKRKLEEMLAEKPQTAATSEAPAAKRPATPAAIAAKKTKSRGWAVAEKLGIAAIGGAIVLGSLIYTAPSF